MINNTYAFCVKPESDFYKKYFEQKKEVEFFTDLSKAFVKEHFPNTTGLIAFSEQLQVQLNEEDAEAYEGQLNQKLTRSEDGQLYRSFKKASEINKLWIREVYSKVDAEKYNYCRFWPFDFTGKAGRCDFSLWDDNNGNIYGYILAHFAQVKVPAYAQVIPMNEYKSHLRFRDNPD